MDESDYFLREFVKTRNKNRLSKVKLKKVVADILLAQKVRRFLFSVKSDSQRPSRQSQPTIKRRLSVRVISPKGTRSTKSNIFGIKSVNENHRPVSQTGAKTPIPAITVSSASRRAPRAAFSEKTICPKLVDRQKSKGEDGQYGHTNTSGSAKMPRINNKSAQSTRSASNKSISPSKMDKRSSGEPQSTTVGWKPKRQTSTSLPALTDTIWAGDPKAISSIRRPRKNAKEMLATYKSGEDTRKLTRQLTNPCTRNCQNPNVFTELERIYTQLPSLFPAIEKAREDMGVESPRRENHSHRGSNISLFPLPPHSASRRPSLAASCASGRRGSVHFQSPAVRHHGALPRQLTAGVGYRHS